MARGPIIDPTRSWGIALNPYGDEPELAGHAVWCYDPVTGRKDIVSEIFATAEEAQAELDSMLAP